MRWNGRAVDQDLAGRHGAAAGREGRGIERRHDDVAAEIGIGQVDVELEVVEIDVDATGVAAGAVDSRRGTRCRDSRAARAGVPDRVVAADVAVQEIVGVDLGDADVAGVVAHQAELIGVAGKVGAIAAAEAVLHADREPLLAQRPHQVVVVAREAELVLDADVHVDALGRDLGGGLRGEARVRVLGEEVLAVGIVVELPVAFAKVARAGHAVEADVLEGLAGSGFVDEIAVRIREGLGVVDDHAVAHVVDSVAVQIHELAVADQLPGDPAAQPTRRATRRQQHVDRQGRRLVGLTQAVRVAVTAVEKAARVAAQRETVELVVAESVAGSESEARYWCAGSG